MTTHRFFDDRLNREWAGFTILKGVFIITGVVHFSLALAAGYRAIRQVYDVSVIAPARVTAGSTVTARFVASGRNRVDAWVELVQDGRVEILARDTIPDNKSRFYDPRPQRAVIHATIPADVHSRFQSGPLSIRAVGAGRMQLLRVPPPVTSEVTTTLDGA